MRERKILKQRPKLSKQTSIYSRNSYEVWWLSYVRCQSVACGTTLVSERYCSTAFTFLAFWLLQKKHVSLPPERALVIRDGTDSLHSFLLRTKSANVLPMTPSLHDWSSTVKRTTSSLVKAGMAQGWWESYWWIAFGKMCNPANASLLRQDSCCRIISQHLVDEVQSLFMDSGSSSSLCPPPLQISKAESLRGFYFAIHARFDAQEIQLNPIVCICFCHELTSYQCSTLGGIYISWYWLFPFKIDFGEMIFIHGFQNKAFWPKPPSQYQVPLESIDQHSPHEALHLLCLQCWRILDRFALAHPCTA